MYQSNEQIIFVLLEATFNNRIFNKPLKIIQCLKKIFNVPQHTLLTIYDGCDNGIFFCMAQILLKMIQKLELFTDEEKGISYIKHKAKLRGIIEYFNAIQTIINPIIYDNIEILADDVCCKLKMKK